MKVRLLTFLALVIAAQALFAQVSHFEIPGYDGLPIDGGGSWFVEHNDIDGDDDEDIIVLRSHQFDQIYINQGGYFTRLPDTASWQVRGGSYDCVFLDLNNDQLDDLIIARGPTSGGRDPNVLLSGRDQILINRGDGTFEERSENLASYHSTYCQFLPLFCSVVACYPTTMDTLNYSMGLAYGNFNGDEYPDLIFANGGVQYLIQVEMEGNFNGCYYDSLLVNDVYFGMPDTNGDGVLNFVDRTQLSGIVRSDLSTDVAVADFDGDGLDDIFITNFNDWTLKQFFTSDDSIFLNKLYLNDTNNPGHFRWAKDNYPLEFMPSTSVVAKDIDGDLDVDLFITNERRADSTGVVIVLPVGTEYQGMTSRLLINDGTGHFGDSAHLLPPIIKEYRSAFHGVVDYFDDDDQLDIFGAGIHNFLFTQNPDHTFTDQTDRLPLFPQTQIPHTFHSYGATAADFDDDTDLDYIIVDTYEQNRYHMQVQGFRFVDTTTTNLPPDGENGIDVAIGDIDGDEDLDAVVVNYVSKNTCAIHLNTGVMINDHPYFTDVGYLLPDVPEQGRGVKLGDIDKDGKLDVMISGYGGGKLYKNMGNANGLPQFEDKTSDWFTSFSTKNKCNEARLIDINHDGWLDIFLPNGKLGENGVKNELFLWDSSNMVFVDVTNAWLPNDNARTLKVDFADVNADGWLDIIASNEDATNNMFLYISTTDTQTAINPGYFIGTPTAFLNNQTSSAVFADFDGDTKMDVVEVSSCCLNGTDSLKYLYMNDGTYTNGVPNFTRKIYGGRDFQNAEVAVYDFNADQYPDVVTCGRGRIGFYLFDAANEELVDTTDNYTPINLVDGLAPSAYGIDFGDMNNDGYIDVYFARDNQNLLLYGSGEVTGVDEVNEQANLLELKVYPNPATNEVSVEYRQKIRSEVEIELYNNIGVKIHSLFLGFQTEGIHTYRVPMNNLSPGLYFVKLISGKSQEVVKLLRIE